MCELSNKDTGLGDSGQFFRLGPKALIAALAKCCWNLAVPIGLGLFIVHVLLRLLGISLNWHMVPWFTALLVVFCWFLVLTVVGHFFRSYRLEEHCLHSREGVLRYRHTVVPLNRVQHAEVVRGLSERVFNLATLIVCTAGPASYAVSVKYLELDLANRMLIEIVPKKFAAIENGAVTD
ncbi:MAG: PH domain-containing protein [Gammaproteobacteria bacterium]|nr:PH domain-containing protein [Gammaproteobacteria bacterium]